LQKLNPEKLNSTRCRLVQAVWAIDFSFALGPGTNAEGVNCLVSVILAAGKRVLNSSKADFGNEVRLGSSIAEPFADAAAMVDRPP
jgi:hypothetical protein